MMTTLHAEGSQWIDKYAPTRLSEVVGHERTIDTLRKMMQQTMLHNIVLCGPHGIGKTTIARLFVREYLGKHVDSQLMWLHMSDDRNIQNIRERLIHFVNKRIDHRSKIVVFEDADNLGDGIQQMLRRTMEQSEHKTTFIIMCNSSSSVIECIQSRCYVIKLCVLPDPLISAHLTTILAAEEVPVTTTVVNEATMLSSGDMRRAINYTQMVANLSSNKLTIESVRTTFMFPNYQRIDRTVKWLLLPVERMNGGDAASAASCESDDVKQFHVALQSLEGMHIEGFSAMDIVHFIRMCITLHADMIPNELLIVLHKQIGICYTRLNVVDSIIQLFGCLACMHRNVLNYVHRRREAS